MRIIYKRLIVYAFLGLYSIFVYYLVYLIIKSVAKTL